MTIIPHPSPNHSPRLPGVRVDTVVIHHTATSATLAGDGAALRTLCDPRPDDPSKRVSAHYFIGHDGRVYVLVPEDRTAWHAGRSRMPWAKDDPKRPSVNPRSIGVELGNPGDGKTPFSEAQYTALARLVPGIAYRHGYDAAVCQTPVEAKALMDKSSSPIFILGHRDVAPGRKTDPADNFDWGRVRAALAGGVA